MRRAAAILAGCMVLAAGCGGGGSRPASGRTRAPKPVKQEPLDFTGTSIYWRNGQALPSLSQEKIDRMEWSSLSSPTGDEILVGYWDRRMMPRRNSIPLVMGEKSVGVEANLLILVRVEKTYLRSRVPKSLAMVYEEHDVYFMSNRYELKEGVKIERRRNRLKLAFTIDEIRGTAPSPKRPSVASLKGTRTAELAERPSVLAVNCMRRTLSQYSGSRRPLLPTVGRGKAVLAAAPLGPREIVNDCEELLAVIRKRFRENE